MRISAPDAAIRARLAFWALAGIGLLVSHDAVFLAQVGPGEELTRLLRGAGHDYWGAASAILVLVGVAAVVAAGLRLRGLGRHAHRLRATPKAGQRARLLPIWLRLMAVVTLGFAIQENLEHVLAHGHAIGAGALLGPEYPLALPIIAAITAVAALLATLVIGAEHALVEAIAAACHRSFGRVARSLRSPVRLALTRRGVRATPGAGRAPPLVLTIG